MEKHFSHILGHALISPSYKEFKKCLTLKCLFSLIFPLLWEFTFPIFWGLYGFLLHPKYLRNPLLWNVFFFPVLCGFTFPMFWELHGFLLQVKNFKKPLTVKCLCFSIFFLYYGISLFPYFGNCMDFCFIQNIWEIHYRGMFFFFFMYYRNSLLPYFENCMDFCFAWNI